MNPLTLTMAVVASLSAYLPAASAQVATQAPQPAEGDARSFASRFQGWTCATAEPDPDLVYPAGYTSGAVWTDGIVPYRYAASVTATQRAAMEAALLHIASRTAVQFVPRTTELDFITIMNGTDPSASSSSALGRAGDEQFLRIAASHWARPGILIHEMGHALGLRHEHQRTDRNAFVTIVSAKVNPTYSSNFGVVAGTLRGIYDFDSIMHYSPFTFSTDGDMTVEVRPPYRFWWQYNIGNGTKLSIGDIHALAALYPTGDVPPTSFSLTGPADGALVGTAAQPELTWAPSTGADVYRLLISRDRSMENPVLDDQIGSTSVALEEPLEPNRIYTWQAIANNAFGDAAPHPIPSRQFYTASEYPQVLHVDASAPSNGTGLSWAEPLTSLREALEVARASSTLNGPTRVMEIRIADGVYTPHPSDPSRTFYIPTGIALRGGYAGFGAADPDLRDPAAFATVLSADLLGNDTPAPESRSDNSGIVAYLMNSAAGTEIDGLTIQGARIVGLSIDKAIVTVKDCTFIDSRGDTARGARASRCSTAGPAPSSNAAA